MDTKYTDGQTDKQIDEQTYIYNGVHCAVRIYE